jgi:Na+/melibiose symporter-like transporter
MKTFIKILAWNLMWIIIGMISFTMMLNSFEEQRERLEKEYQTEYVQNGCIDNFDNEEM